MTAAPQQRLNILGGEVDAVSPADMLRFVEHCVAGGGSAVVANHNSHSLYLLRRDARLRAFFADADLIQVDSTPMIGWGKLLGMPLSRRHRSTYLDWREDFWRLADENGWRVFYLGGAPGVAVKASERLGQRWSNVTLASRDGYFDATSSSAENAEVLAQIAAFKPDILLVGMGMPRQELWIHENRAALSQGVIFPVGAAFDYEADMQVAAPRWTGRLGLEWLFRLASQPRRLAGRYLVEPWFLLPAAVSDLGAALAARR